MVEDLFFNGDCATEYENLKFKIPKESADYEENSKYVISQILSILDERKKSGDNKIIINTNLKAGLPLENINKIAGSISRHGLVKFSPE